MKEALGVGLIGCGTVGGGVAIPSGSLRGPAGPSCCVGSLFAIPKSRAPCHCRRA
jgi:hypothetical protein